MNKLHIHPSFIIMWTLFVIWDKSSFILYIFAAAAVHEIAHLYAYLIFKAEIERIDVLPFGLSMKLKDASALTPRQEAVCASAGVVINLLTALCTYLASGTNFFFMCNLSLALINSVPVFPLDGGRVLYFAMLSIYSQPTAEKISTVVSAVSLIPLTAASIWLLLKTGFNFSLALIDAYLIFYFIFRRRMA